MRRDLEIGIGDVQGYVPVVGGRAARKRRDWHLAQDPPPDHIVIETSGLALPQPLVQAFNWPDIRASVRLDGVITLVDGPAIQAGGFVQDMAALDAQRQADEELDHESPIEELFSDQLEAANLILLSKSDLLDAEAIASVSQTISQSNQSMQRSHRQSTSPPGKP